MRLIDADALRAQFPEPYDWTSIAQALVYITVWAAIDSAPTIEPERKKGKWIIHPIGIYAHLVCDKCLSNAPYDCKTNFCPNCGADMRSEEK